MKPTFSVIAALALGISVFAVGFGLAVTPAVAQTNATDAGNATTATPTETEDGGLIDDAREEVEEIGDGGGDDQADDPPEEGDDSSSPDPNSGVGSDSIQSLDSDVNLTSWSYSEGVFTMTFEHSGRAPKVLTFTEATQPEEGVQRFSTRRERITAGTNTIRMRTLIEGSNSAVGITSQESQENGYGIIISTGNNGQNPFRNFGGTSGLLSGVGISIFLSGGAAAFVIWLEETGVIEA